MTTTRGCGVEVVAGEAMVMLDVSRYMGAAACDGSEQGAVSIGDKDPQYEPSGRCGEGCS